jgi:hypothetical protein
MPRHPSTASMARGEPTATTTCNATHTTMMPAMASTPRRVGASAT